MLIVQTAGAAVEGLLVTKTQTVSRRSLTGPNSSLADVNPDRLVCHQQAAVSATALRDSPRGQALDRSVAAELWPSQCRAVTGDEPLLAGTRQV